MAKPRAALNVIVSAGGTVNLRLPVFTSGKVAAMIITTLRGARQLRKHRVPDSVQIHAIRRGSGEIPAADILRAVGRAITGKRILVEGGPRLLATFYKERLIDEQFLSLAPQLSGREIGDARMGLVMGKTFAPRDPLWGRLSDVRQGSRLLFLRYSF
jgi:riboflavin biosynthesis pyrimidine reductase